MLGCGVVGREADVGCGAVDVDGTGDAEVDLRPGDTFTKIIS